MIKVGDLINDTYHLLGILGQGGMGTVYESRDMKLDTLVAIKFMKPEVLADRQIVERFFVEARALAKLKSQHAVKVLHLGTHLGMPYIVMEHLQGFPMNRYLDERFADGRGSLSAGEAAWYLWQACEAIEEAHSLGIIHRDIKPANMFLANGPGGKTIAKVLDFGIAKMVRQMDETVRKEGNLTATHAVMGTPMYMSPEQARESREVDGRADIWSLGIVLYELVTGELPFAGIDFYALRKAIVEEQPIRRQMPPAVEVIVQRCLNKDRNHRYQSTRELAEALQRIIAEPASSVSSPIAPQPSQSTGGGTVVINGQRGTVTVLPPLAPPTPETLSAAVTHHIESASKSSAARNRVFAIAAVGVAAVVMLGGTVIFEIQSASSNATALTTSASALLTAASAESNRIVVTKNSVHQDSPTAEQDLRNEITAQTDASTPRDTPMNVAPPKPEKTSTGPAPGSTPRKTTRTR